MDEEATGDLEDLNNETSMNENVASGAASIKAARTDHQPTDSFPSQVTIIMCWQIIIRYFCGYNIYCGFQGGLERTSERFHLEAPLASRSKTSAISKSTMSPRPK
ncbi:MAG: hypothetical protein Q9226_007380 [Calogaya cf. arnoldii]